MAPCPAPGLLILACSATKRDGPSYMLAIERYDGPRVLQYLARLAGSLAGLQRLD